MYQDTTKAAEAAASILLGYADAEEAKRCRFLEEIFRQFVGALDGRHSWLYTFIDKLLHAFLQCKFVRA